MEDFIDFFCMMSEKDDYSGMPGFRIERKDKKGAVEDAHL